MPRIYAIALNTFREAVRDRVLYVMLAIASALLLLTLAVARLSLNQDLRVVLDLGLASISLFAVLIAIFLGSSLLYKEIDKKTLYVILPKPIARYEFLVGKYFGITLTASVFVAIMGAIQLWVTSVQADAPGLWLAVCPLALLAVLGLLLWRAHDRTAVLLPWSALALAASAAVCATSTQPVAPLLFAFALNVGEVLVLAAVALFFSSFSTPFLTGLFTFGVWLVGRSADAMVTMKSKVIGPQIEALLRGIAEVAPNFNLFVPGRHTLAHHALGYVATTLGYGVLYAAVVLTLAALVFRRRDFV